MPHVRARELDRLKAAARACAGFTEQELQDMQEGALAHAAALSRLAHVRLMEKGYGMDMLTYRALSAWANLHEAPAGVLDMRLIHSVRGSEANAYVAGAGEEGVPQVIVSLPVGKFTRQDELRVLVLT